MRLLFIIFLFTSIVSNAESELLNDSRMLPKCIYKGYHGYAVVKSIKKTPESKAQKKNVDYEGYEILFTLELKIDKMDEKLKKSINKPYTFLLNNGLYPGEAYIEKYKIRVGKKYPGILKVRVSGNCPRPIFFDEPTLNADDYFEGYLSQPDCIEEVPVITVDKPIIYIYPLKKQDTIVELINNKNISFSYPKYSKDGWKVTAHKDGMLIDSKTKKKYYSLFWEAKDFDNFKFSQGYVVKGSKSAEYLDEKLKTLGLNWKERNEFIIYWLPKLEKNEYNLISFINKEYTDKYPIKISPKPDTLIRVFMIFKKVNEDFKIKAQVLQSVKRSGYTVVEWGGSEIE